MKDVYPENWKKLTKTKINRNTCHVHGLRDLTLLKRQHYWKRSPWSVQPYQHSKGVFGMKRKTHPIFTWNLKGPQVAKTTSKNRNASGGITYPDFNTSQKTVFTYPARLWRPDRPVEQNRGHRDKHIWWNDFWWGCQDHVMGGGQSF